MPPDGGEVVQDIRWLMSSDACKHCTEAGCLDVCPTSAPLRAPKFGTAVVQEEACDGCGYCVPACPFVAFSRREEDGRAWKGTLCYDRLKGGMEPACATESIHFGLLTELRERAAARPTALQAEGVVGARRYGDDADDGIGRAGAFGRTCRRGVVAG